MANKKVKIITTCEEGICPICGGSLEYGEAKMLDETKPWTCTNCGARGEEGFQHKYPAPKDGSEWEDYVEFDGTHSNVHLKDGTPVEIEAPAEPEAPKEKEPITIEAVCKETRCPVCDGELDYTGNDGERSCGIQKEWICFKCKATGWGQFNEEWIHSFNNEHRDVRLKDGTPVHIVMPQTTKLWKIPVTWEMCGYAYVDAPTLEGAMEKVRCDNDDIPLPGDASYVDGSFDLSYDDVEEVRSLHNDNEPDVEVRV